ncbi:hypothetical protein [Photorhabdus laumondii]|nr:hypothetical protein [Photorhabdus laumondii]
MTDRISCTKREDVLAAIPVIFQVASLLAALTHAWSHSSLCSLAVAMHL